MNMTPELADLLRYLRTFADDEGLIRWSPDYLAPLVSADPAGVPIVMAAMTETGYVLPYRGGRSRMRLAYFVGAERGMGTSELPPPSIQNGATLTAYKRRDGGICHLCRFEVNDAWNRQREWSSFDHVIPRSMGGSDYPSNIRIAHVSCNKARRNRPVEAFNGSPLSRALFRGSV